MSAAGIHLSVFCPERRLIESSDVEEVTIEGSEGQIQILPGHAPMIGTLHTGIMSYRKAGQEPVFGVISTGFFEVKDDRLSLMAETFELKSEIDVDRAKKAQQIAENTLREANLDEHSFKKYQLKLQRSVIRQHLGN